MKFRLDKVSKGVITVLFFFGFAFSNLNAQSTNDNMLKSSVLYDADDATCSKNVTADYYASAYKLYGTALRTALHNIVKGHTTLGYAGLYTAFPTTDAKPGNIVWDMYSDIPGGTPQYTYTHGVKKCGSYGGEGDCYNREHSFPDSWLGTTEPARSDLFHMIPTDGYVNNRRSNYNFGIVTNATWTSSNGSKVGSSGTIGYSGTVFEPINEYKGDLSRSSMYISVRYYTEDSGFGSSDGTSKSDLIQWYANQLYAWSVQDTVSTKEINRNETIYGFQHNRNPFIDHPEFASEIWKTDMLPAIVSAKQINPSSVIVDFSRILDSTSVLSAANFVCDNSLGNPSAISYGVNYDFSKVQLSFPGIAQGTNYALTIKNVKSINGLAMHDTTVYFPNPIPTGIHNDVKVNRDFSLQQNYPNPFNPSTEIAYNVNSPGMVTLKVYDVLGNVVKELVNNWVSAGSYKVAFDATAISSGVYYYQMRLGNNIETKKLILMK